MELFNNTSAVVKKIYTTMTSDLGEGWNSVLEGGKNILLDVSQKLVDNKGTICPSSGDVFRAFRECKYSKLKVVWVLQDPYHQVHNGIRVADGIAMSCSKTGILQLSLRLVYEEIDRTVGHTDVNPDLKKWSQQGILMLNTALTVNQGMPGSHTDIWRMFTHYLLRTLGEHRDIIWIFSGTHAKGFSGLVKGDKYFTTHPASAAYRGGIWDSEDLFNNINYALERRGCSKILW